MNVEQIKTAVTTEADTLKGVAQQFEHKQAGWAKRNLIPLGIGLILGIILGWFVHGL